MRLVAWGTPGSSATRKQWGPHTPVLSLANTDIWAGESGVEPVLGTAGCRAAALVSARWMPQTPCPGVAAKMLQTSPRVSWGTKLPPVEKGWHRIKSLRTYDEVTEQSTNYKLLSINSGKRQFCPIRHRLVRTGHFPLMTSLYLVDVRGDRSLVTFLMNTDLGQAGPYATIYDSLPGASGDSISIAPSGEPGADNQSVIRARMRGGRSC